MQRKLQESGKHRKSCEVFRRKRHCKAYNHPVPSVANMVYGQASSLSTMMPR